MAASLSVEKSLTQARQAAKKQDWLTAVTLNQAVLERFPKNKKAAKALAEMRVVATEGLFQRAQVAEQQDDWPAAITHLRAAFYLAPTHPQVACALAKCLLEDDQAVEALKVCDDILAISADLPRALILRGQALHELNRPDEAVQVLEKARVLTPDDTIIYRLLGAVAQSQGELETAEQHFEAGLQVDPMDVGLLRHISVVKRKVDASDPLIAQMRQAIAKLGKDNPRSAYVQFALFDLLHKCKDHAAAFSHLQQGNALLAKTTPYDFRSEAIAGAYAKSLFPEPIPESGTEPDTRFIFVTGLPRTGTTLTERILARDANVQACGELNILRAAVIQQMQTLQAKGQAQLSAQDIQALRDLLLSEFDSLSDGRPVMVDKMPLNFRWIGFIAAALPEARIVHMSRDPRAVAWSLYRQVFKGRAQGFVNSFDDIARFMIYHRDLMQHWNKVCGDRVFDLGYGALVNEPIASTKALAEATRLTWSEDWLTPEKATNHVRTASAVQVTQPVYKDSDQGWRVYEAELAPMLKALTTAGLI
ncbi:tetratricopeptide repeat-containing sulfotransferase family protein [Cognatishimia maritima]|uniref:Tetratricopeptide repeat-containing protein n=1 Tax=Cognatishimia maritima TaxID=870908 RepID=A0A1M5TSK1_9RHOB|nr:sulfotransferase [Cognatishimia maritima]SHH53762.1 Tetratricopeptide repeat-containing protein [Cognatishimia maritima]